MTPDERTDALAEVLAEHADCVANDSRSREWIDGSGVTGIDVWSCGLEVPFVDDLDAMHRAHLATALRALLASERAKALREAADEVTAECSRTDADCYCGSSAWLLDRADREEQP